MTAKSAYFYADDGVIASIDPGWLQLAFDFLARLFDQVGLQMNVHKTVRMVFWPFRAAGVQADEAYTRRMAGEGRIFKDQQREHVLCPL